MPLSDLQGSSVSASPLQRDWQQSLSQLTRVQQEKHTMFIEGISRLELHISKADIFH